jgi:uncharacterized iron-regulated membrane protein
MHTKTLRNWIFPLHRYIGLAVGLILIIVGLTGSLLVFRTEIDAFLIRQQIGAIAPQGEKLPIRPILDTVQAAYPEQKPVSVNTLPKPEAPYMVFLTMPNSRDRLQVFVNPYTGQILGERVWEKSPIGWLRKLHYDLLAGKIGQAIVGFVAFLLLILSFTGLALWPGWRKLLAGFKIKWNAHPKRVNFDIHKVAGILSLVFFILTAFTGFCWNFYDQVKPVIYAATATPILPSPSSKPIPNQTPLNIETLLQKADAVFPDASTTFFVIPQKPEAAFRVDKKQPQESEEYGHTKVYLDQYTGEIVEVQDGLRPTRARAFGCASESSGIS